MRMREIIEFEGKVKDLDPRDKALAYLNLANELLAAGMDPAVPAFKALHLFHDIKDASGVVQASILLANHLYTAGQNVHALNHLLAARTFLEQHGLEEPRSKAYLLNKIGFLHFQLKEHAEAIDAFTSCVDKLEALGDHGEIMKIYGTLGFIFNDLDQGEKANEMFAAAARIARDTGNATEEAKYTSFIT